MASRCDAAAERLMELRERRNLRWNFGPFSPTRRRRWTLAEEQEDALRRYLQALAR